MAPYLVAALALNMTRVHLTKNRAGFSESVVGFQPFPVLFARIGFQTCPELRTVSSIEDIDGVDTRATWLLGLQVSHVEAKKIGRDPISEQVHDYN
jgi:hypothetical protein